MFSIISDSQVDSISLVERVDSKFTKRLALPRQGVNLKIVEELSISVDCIEVVTH